VKNVCHTVSKFLRFSLGVTAEALCANIGSKFAISLKRGPVDPIFQVEGVAPTNHSSSQKNRLNDWYGIKCGQIFLSFILGRQPTTRRSETPNIKKNIILLCSTSPKCQCAAKQLSSFVIFAELLPLRNVEWLV